MSNHYVIVHESVVSLSRGSDQKRAVLAEIERIKKQEDWSNSPGNSSELGPNLPRSREGLVIFVCGAFSGTHLGEDFWCVDTQLSSLKKAGYDAKVHQKGTLKVDHFYSS